MWLWSSIPRKQSSCLWLMCTWRVLGLSWAARWTSTAASTGNQCLPGDSSVTEQSGGQLWELWVLPGLESLFLSEADVENKQVTGGVNQHHLSVGMGWLLWAASWIVEFSWKAVCSAYHSGSDSHEAAQHLYVFYSLPPLCGAMNSVLLPQTLCRVPECVAQGKSLVLYHTCLPSMPFRTRIINVWWLSGEK